MQTPLQTPQAMRKTMSQRRKALTNAEQSYAAQQLALRISRHPLFRKAKSFSAYIAANGEISLAPLIRLAHKQGKKCYLPVLEKNNVLVALQRKERPHKSKAITMRFSLYPKGGRLTQRLYGLLEPTKKHISAINAIDFIICPLVAFDTQGNRLGMGGGFYDRALSKVANRRQKRIWGAAHNLQQAKLSPQSWDKKLDGIFTASRVINATP